MMISLVWKSLPLAPNMQENYKSMTEGERIEALDEINDNYKSLLSYNPDGSFMEHSKYILELMESRYLEQYGQD